MKKIIKHIQRWNIWRKTNLNGPLHKFLVLVGLRKSPSMQFTFTPDEIKAFEEGFEKGLKETQAEWATLYEGVPVNIEEFDPEEEENDIQELQEEKAKTRTRTYARSKAGSN